MNGSTHRAIDHPESSRGGSGKCEGQCCGGILKDVRHAMSLDHPQFHTYYTSFTLQNRIFHHTHLDSLLHIHSPNPSSFINLPPSQLLIVAPTCQSLSLFLPTAPPLSFFLPLGPIARRPSSRERRSTGGLATSARLLLQPAARPTSLLAPSAGGSPPVAWPQLLRQREGETGTAVAAPWRWRTGAPPPGGGGGVGVAVYATTTPQVLRLPAAWLVVVRSQAPYPLFFPAAGGCSGASSPARRLTQRAHRPRLLRRPTSSASSPIDDTWADRRPRGRAAAAPAPAPATPPSRAPYARRVRAEVQPTGTRRPLLLSPPQNPPLSPPSSCCRRGRLTAARTPPMKELLHSFEYEGIGRRRHFAVGAKGHHCGAIFFIPFLEEGIKSLCGWMVLPHESQGHG
jgi:hypothetical protein